MKTISIQEIQPESYFIASCAPVPGSSSKSFVDENYLPVERQSITTSERQTDRQTDSQTDRRRGKVA